MPSPLTTISSLMFSGHAVFPRSLFHFLCKMIFLRFPLVLPWILISIISFIGMVKKKRLLTNHSKIFSSLEILLSTPNGQDLIDGFLFRPEIWTLKKNIFQRSGGLRSEECFYKYVIRGRTDFVRLNQRRVGITKRNIQYYIEIKSGLIAEEELKEAFYQLLGGNAASYYRSPPVFLTNLSKSHFVLFITQCANPEVLYELQIFQFPTFGSAMNYLEGTTSELKCCTIDFLRRPTLLSPPKKDQDGDDDNDDDREDWKVSIEEVLDVDDESLEDI